MKQARAEARYSIGWELLPSLPGQYRNSSLLALLLNVLFKIQRTNDIFTEMIFLYILSRELTDNVKNRTDTLLYNTSFNTNINIKWMMFS